MSAALLLLVALPTAPISGLAPTGVVGLDLAPRGSYVEARTASVFAGACHYGGEATTVGRDALLAWHFDGGMHAGAPLAGVDAVAVITSEANLAERAPRRSVLYLDESASPASREAARAWIVGRNSAALGEIASVRVVQLSVAFDGERFDVASPERFELRGALLPDRACCKMPLQVWYEPFERLERPIVGFDEAFRFDDAAALGGRSWSRPGENASFAGRFVERREAVVAVR